MPVLRITNPLSNKSGHQQRKKLGPVLCLCFILCGVFICVAVFHIRTDLGQQNQQQNQHGHIRQVADNIKSENFDDGESSFDKTLSPKSKDLDDDIESIGTEEGNIKAFDGTVTLTTDAGEILIKLRPDLSQPSADYIISLIQSTEMCNNCRFYRAEKPGILQGILAKKSVKINETLGKCPDEYKASALLIDKKKCPDWDPDCGCHGPIMTRGMVGWAAGEGGPDFFIDMYKRPATHWENQHTVWGEVIDENSLAVIDEIFDMEVRNRGGMHYLKEPLHITPTYIG